jgi:hypothetical protein
MLKRMTQHNFHSQVTAAATILTKMEKLYNPKAENDTHSTVKHFPEVWGIAV